MMFFTDLRLINNFDPSSRNDRMTIRTGIPIDNPIRRLLDISVVLTIPVVDSRPFYIMVMELRLQCSAH